MQFGMTTVERDPFLMRERSENDVRGCGGLGLESLHHAPHPWEGFLQGQRLRRQRTALDARNSHVGPRIGSYKNFRLRSRRIHRMKNGALSGAPV